MTKQLPKKKIIIIKKKQSISKHTRQLINGGILLEHTKQWLLPVLFVSKLSVFTQKSVIIPSKVFKTWD